MVSGVGRSVNGVAGRVAARGGAWTVAERLFSQVSQLAVFIVGARILGPAEFGVFALVSAVAFVLLRVAELGWPSFVMNWSGNERVPRQVLTLALLSGAVVGAIALAATGMAAALGLGPDVVAVAALFSLWVALGPFAGALHGLMVWRGQLVTASLCEGAGEAAALVVSIVSLLQGHGILALAYGRLAYIGMRIGLSVLATRAVPITDLHDAPLGQMRGFSISVVATRLVYALRAHIGTFLVGLFLGPVAVGHYRAAERLTGAAAEVIGAPVEKIAWSYLRGARDAPDGGIGSALWADRTQGFLHAVTVVSVPLFLWVALMSEEIVVGLIGPEWAPAALAASLLALSRIPMTYGAAVEPALALAGEIRRMPGAMLLFLILAAALTTLAAPFGLLAVSGAQIAVGVAVFVVTLRLLERHAAIPREALLSGIAPVLLASLAAVVVALVLRMQGLGASWHPLAQALMIGLLSLPFYAAALLSLDGRARTALRSMAA